MTVTCAICGAPARLVSQQKIYGRTYNADKRLWACSRWPTCDSFVGCHPNSDQPLGTLADAATRRARQSAHNVFDRLWRERHMTRAGAYAWLSKDFGYQVHIGESDAFTCARIEHWAQGKLYQLGVS